eukprot:Plantae.Rhodophyta-Hildenbrandia_rubra.ctg4675.p1 GENE.Plantae.Rhodophyta-Hildenbrandia_rubra.ctg4675~~Plantae.Rhodophyta-Hildenbrandia_rubra.ctg4675.p1  ORF type:complete len:393 (+),score=50.37 Plantae.Rhodophyta-Hildenbrandia_rubra.ctg4675:564-1742(+)
MGRGPGDRASSRVIRILRRISKNARRVSWEVTWIPRIHISHMFWILILSILTAILYHDNDIVKTRNADNGGRFWSTWEQLMRRIGWGLKSWEKYVFQNAGYSRVASGTFRDQYPATEIVGDRKRGVVGAFDVVFAINHGECGEQWQVFRDRIEDSGLRVSRVNSFNVENLRDDDVGLNRSIWLSRLSGVQKRDLKRNVGYFLAHRRIWDLVVEKRYSRVLVMDTTLFPTARLLRNLPDMFNAIDTESIALRRPWHMVYFRRYPAEVDSDDSEKIVNMSRLEEPWTVVHDLGRAVAQTVPSFGAGMYALSAAGARILNKQANIYSTILDVQLALLQKDMNGEFVILSPCGLQRAVKDRCTDLVDQVLGDSAFQCVWRRLQERQLSDKKLSDFE